MENTAIEADVLGNGFKNQKISLENDYDGEQHATLVFRNTKQETSKAVLYIHGFIDYFFQTELADHFNEWGYNFYAVDLRKYGRSLMAHQHPNYTENIHNYFEEIDESIRVMKSRGNKEIILIGHSTGGLTTSLYAHHKKNIDGLILNSPFFELNISKSLKAISPLVILIGKYFPYLKTDGLTQHYPQSLHKNYKGSWEFNENWKPITNFPAYLGWTRAISRAQKELQNGLDIHCPILVLHSDKSYFGKNWDEQIRTSDAVLNIDDMKQYADGLGKDVTKTEIKDGIHDLVLSKTEVKKTVYLKMQQWLLEKGL